MLVVVDESGDAGLKIGKGSSRFFSLALVLFEESHEVEAVDNRINQLRQELGLHKLFEFKFNRCNLRFQEAFLHAVSPYNFFFLGIVIDKSKLPRAQFKQKGSFYKYAAALAFTNARPYFDEATVIIDGSATKDFRLEFGSYLRQRVNEGDTRHIRKVKFKDSAKNNLLQLADMIAGAISRTFSDKSDSVHAFEIVKHRQIFVQGWPK
jgi:hypothetical protein